MKNLPAYQTLIYKISQDPAEQKIAAELLKELKEKYVQWETMRVEAARTPIARNYPEFVHYKIKQILKPYIDRILKEYGYNSLGDIPVKDELSILFAQDKSPDFKEMHELLQGIKDQTILGPIDFVDAQIGIAKEGEQTDEEVDALYSKLSGEDLEQHFFRRKEATEQGLTFHMKQRKREQAEQEKQKLSSPAQGEGVDKQPKGVHVSYQPTVADKGDSKSQAADAKEGKGAEVKEKKDTHADKDKDKGSPKSSPAKKS